MMDLEKAKFLVKTNALEDLSATHVVALLKAGEKIPEFVCEKFADVVEKFNPVPG